MSDADFKGAWDEFFGKVAQYSSAQRGALLIGTKAHLRAALTEVGAPEKAAEKPAPAAASAGASTAAAAPAAAAPAQAGAKADPVTGNRVSTKVAQAPGGASSISLGDDGKASSKTSVKVAAAPGGGSSIQLGDDSTGRSVGDDAGSKPKKFTAGRKQLAPAGGHSHDIFSNDSGAKEKTSVRTAQPAGGKSSISLGSDGASPAASPTAAAAASAAAPAAAGEKSDGGAGGDELTPALMQEISAAVYRKGKVKDTFTKLTQNAGKLTQVGLKEGMINIIGVPLSDAQAARLMAKFTKDPNAGMSFPDFVKMLAV